MSYDDDNASRRDGNSAVLASEKKANEMSDDGTRITIRMGLEEIQMMEDFMSDHEIENRSDFVRDAVRAYIDLVRSGRPVQQESGIFVRFSELQLSALSGLVSLGVSLDEEEFVRKCVLDKILPKAVEEEAYENAFRAAQRNAALKRRKKGWDNRRLPGRMGTAKAETGECATWKPFKKRPVGMQEMAYNNGSEDANLPKIAVVGVGGAGCNVITSIHDCGINVRTIAINTDKSALHEGTRADQKIYICREVLKGEGAKGDATLGKTCADIHKDEIRDAVAGYSLVFVIGGLGGGTGTGAMPVVIEAAQSQNIKTFAVAIQPFAFEGRSEVAKTGYQHIRGVCENSALVSNDVAMELMPDLTMNQMFRVVNMSILRYVIEIAGETELEYTRRMAEPGYDAECPMEYALSQLSVAES